MMNERQKQILEILGQNEQTSVKELSQSLKVSSVTIRQDLNSLKGEGLLKRVHGGAVLGDADDMANRLGINYEKKLRIAKKLATYINENETVLIESGSANALLARELVKKNVTVITTNVYIARQFRNNHHARIILLGGLYQHESESLVGKITKTCIDQINYDKAFIGIDGYDTKTGFTLRDLFRAEISSYIIRKSKEVFIVSDSGKFGQIAMTPICSVCEIHHVATDTELPEKYINELSASGIDLILA
jgi:DeoR/GlpR family transcriptional regulator of sugar metabolism